VSDCKCGKPLPCKWHTPDSDQMVHVMLWTLGFWVASGAWWGLPAGFALFFCIAWSGRFI
jgi:hypothetical protein